MKNNVACIALSILLVPTLGFGFGLGDLTGAADALTGSDSGGGAGGAEGMIHAATARFLRGSEKLALAMGDDAAAAKCAKLREKAEDGDVVDLSDVSEELENLAGDEGKLRTAETSKVMDAAVDVGAATMIEAKAVDLLRSNPKALAGNPITAGRLAKTAPTNLKAMVNVQSSLYSYLKTKGEDPAADAREAAEALEKG